jgi:hypothetical protein
MQLGIDTLDALLDRFHLREVQSEQKR